MCYEPKPKARCSCGHVDVNHENEEGACLYSACECAEYDGPPRCMPRWIFSAHRGLAITRESVLAGEREASLDGCPAPKLEHYFRDLLAAQVGGRAEVTLPFGRADVLTDTTVYEVEPAQRWREGVAQALQYAAQVPQQGAVALYGDETPRAKVRTALAALPPPGLELWWLSGEQFIRIDEDRGA